MNIEVMFNWCEMMFTRNVMMTDLNGDSKILREKHYIFDIRRDQNIILHSQHFFLFGHCTLWLE